MVYLKLYLYLFRTLIIDIFRILPFAETVNSAAPIVESNKIKFICVKTIEFVLRSEFNYIKKFHLSHAKLK